jgi:hypothetical protein
MKHTLIALLLPLLFSACSAPPGEIPIGELPFAERKDLLNLLVASIDRSDPPLQHILPEDAGQARAIIHRGDTVVSYFERSGAPYIVMIEIYPYGASPPIIQTTKEPRLLKWFADHIQ